MLKSLRIYLFLIFLAICHMPYAICHLFAEDKIVAIVNNDVITQKDLNDFINFMRMQLTQEYSGQQLETKIQSIKLDLLDRLIEDRLILQEAKKADLKIDENRIKARAEEIRKRYSSDAEFQRVLAQQGLTQADIQNKIREQMLTYAIIEAKIRSKITVNPAEVTDFYEKNTELFKISEQREVTSLSIDDENLANDLFNNLKTGGDLSNLQSKYPAMAIDKITVRKDAELRKDIEDALFKLNLAEISAPLKINNIFYIFRLDNIIAPRQQGLSEAQERISSFLFENKMQEELTAWLDQLKAQSYVKIPEN